MAEAENRNLQRFMEMDRKLVVHLLPTEGIEHLEEIPEGRAIFATSHLSDVDLPAAASVIAKYRDIHIASLATNQRDPLQSAVMRVTDTRAFFHDLSNTFDTKKQKPHMSFNAGDFDQMVNQMRQGSDMMIAAHDVTRNWRLAKHPGVGAVILAQMAGAPVIPVALDIHTSYPTAMAADLSGTIIRAAFMQRPAATLRIGSVITLDKIPEVELRKAFNLLSGNREQLRTSSDYDQAKKVYKTLKEQGGVIMQQIAAMLPEEKRGVWNVKPPGQQSAVE